MPCLVFSMSLLSFFLKNPRGETAEVTASTWATFRKCGSRKRFKASGRKQGRFSVQGFLEQPKFPWRMVKNPPKMIQNSKIHVSNIFFSYNHLHFISFYLFCVADSSTHIQNISGQFAPCHPYHLPTVTRFSWNDLRSLIRKKIVSNLCQSCWSGKSIPSCRVWTVHIKTVTDYKYDTFCLWNMTSCPILVISYNNLGDEWTGNFGILWLKHILHYSYMLCI